MKNKTEIGVCVICGKEIKPASGMRNYPYYVDGAGALCPACWKKIYMKERKTVPEEEFIPGEK